MTLLQLDLLSPAIAGVSLIIALCLCLHIVMDLSFDSAGPSRRPIAVDRAHRAAAIAEGDPE